MDPIKSELSRAPDKIERIPSVIEHDGTQMQLSEPTMLDFNAVHVFLGSKGCGKTYCALKNVYQALLTGSFHLFVYAIKGGDRARLPATFRAFAKKFRAQNLPFEVVDSDHVVGHLDTLNEAKRAYTDQRDDEARTDTPDPDICEALHVEDWTRDEHHLHTLAMLDDIGGDPIVVKRTDTPMSRPLQSCRHNTTTFILVVHEWVNSMTVHIRTLVNVVFLFHGLNRIQLTYIKRNVAFDDSKFATALGRMESYLSRGRRACIRMDRKSIGVLTLDKLGDLRAIKSSSDDEASSDESIE
jgi:hypothetical protein